MDLYSGSYLGENGELWLRCVFCGDSVTHPEKCHFSINLKTGLYHCYRCRTSGKLSPTQMLALMMRVGVQEVFSVEAEAETSVVEPLPVLLPGPGLSRPSALSRFHYRDEQRILYDAFQVRDPLDEAVTGVFLRETKQKKSRMVGGGGFGWVGESLPVSSPERPLRIVEGPYDVLGKRDVCTFGMVTQGLMDLRGHFILLTPDGDVWQNPDLLFPFLKHLEILLFARKPGHPYLMGVELIPGGKDPDEVPVKQREYVSRGTLVKSRLAIRINKTSQFLEGLLSS